MTIITIHTKNVVKGILNSIPMFLNHDGPHCTSITHHTYQPLDGFWRFFSDESCSQTPNQLWEAFTMVIILTNGYSDYQGNQKEKPNWRDFSCGSFSSLLPRPWGAVATCLPILQHCCTICHRKFGFKYLCPSTLFINVIFKSPQVKLL